MMNTDIGGIRIIKLLNRDIFIDAVDIFDSALYL